MFQLFYDGFYVLLESLIQFLASLYHAADYNASLVIKCSTFPYVTVRDEVFSLN